MKRRESGVHGWNGALLALAAAVATAVIAVGCQNPLASRASGSDTGSTVGAISGFAYYSGETDHGGIVVSAESTDGATSKAVARALSAGTVGSRTIAAAFAGQTTTDATGAYTLSDLPEGTYTLYASSSSSLERAVVVSVNVTAGRSVTAPDLLLTPTGEITGKATLGGATTGNLGVIVFVAGTSYAAMTDDDGSFTISSVPAATGYTLVASKQGYDSAIASVDVTAGVSTSVNALNLPVHIVAATTGSVTGTARLSGLSTGFNGIFVYLLGTSSITTTDEKGSFTLTDVTPGAYTLVANKDNYRQASMSVAISAGETRNVGTLYLPRDIEVTTVGGVALLPGREDGTASRFNSPYGITAYAGYLYVADTYNHTIRKMSALREVTTLAGAGGYLGSSDGTGAAARFQNPYGITAYGDYLYVADTYNHTIRMVSISTSEVTTLAGTAGSIGNRDGAGALARFNYPQSISTDGVNLYVADTNNHTIRKIAISTGVVTTLAGTAGNGGSTDGSGAAARFYFPRGITAYEDYLYVADSANFTIRKVAISTGVVTTLAGTAGLGGSSDGIGAAARFNYPRGISTDGVNLYVADTNSHTIRKIAISTGVVTTVAGAAGISGSTDGTAVSARFYYPADVAADHSTLYIADSSNHTIRRTVGVQ